MASCSPKLPLIDLADKTLKPGSLKWVEVRSDVRKALEDYGCFEVSYDKVSLELQESITKAMEDLFSLPVETKKRNVCPKPYVGYLNHNDLSESLGIQNPNIFENANDFTQQLWPGEGNKHISTTIQLFSEKLVEIDVMVRKMVMESYGIEKYIDEQLNSTNYRIRLMKYVAPLDDDADTTAEDNADVGADAGVEVNVDVSDNVSTNATVSADVNGEPNVGDDVNGDVVAKNDVSTDDADDGVNGDVNVGVNGDVNVNTDVGVNLNVGVDAKNGTTGDDGVEANDIPEVEDTKLSFPCHTDKNILTVLFQHQIEGLEVKTKDGKWIRLKPSPNTFVVIAGDSLCALMNGRITAPLHRVRVTEKKRTRYTAAIFACPKPGFIIDSPKELLDEKHPRVFKPFDYLDFFHFYHTEAGRKAPSTLQAFCAVSEA